MSSASTTVQVENRVGASGQIGSAYVKSAAADGTTLLLTPDQASVVVPRISPTANYDALKDFVPLGQVARYQWALSVPSNSPAKNLAGYVDLLRARPQDANYGIPGKGGLPKVIGAVIQRKIKDMPLLLDPTDLEGAKRELAKSQAFWEKAMKAKK